MMVNRWRYVLLLTASIGASVIGRARGDVDEAKPAAPSVKLDFDHGRAGAIDSLTHDSVWPRDPLLYLSYRMGDVAGDLSVLKTGEPVQTQQQEVVSRLDELIKQLEQSSKGGSGSSANPTRPMQRSQIAGGPGGGELHDSKSGAGQWGNLPPRQREQILQSRTEGFPPGYEQILKSYYQRLAQERVTEDPGPSPSPLPSTRPASH